MKIKNGLYLALVAALAFPMGASASIIFDNGGPAAGGGSGASDFDPFGVNVIYQEIADNFSIGSAESVSGIHWWGTYTPNNQAGAVADDFTIRILDGGLSTIASVNVGAVSSVDTGLDNTFGLDIYGYSASFSPIDLVAGSYWLSIVNNTVGDAEGERWSWAATAAGDGALFRQRLGTPLTGTDPWVATTTNFAFSIAVPEPGTLGLLGLGLLGLAASRRRKAG